MGGGTVIGESKCHRTFVLTYISLTKVNVTEKSMKTCIEKIKPFLRDLFIVFFYNRIISYSSSICQFF